MADPSSVEPSPTEEPFAEEPPPPAIADPIEPLNRILFVVNNPLLEPARRDRAGGGFLPGSGLLRGGHGRNRRRQGVQGGERGSLRIGEYEDLTKSAIDPYGAVRDAYSQYRAKKVKE
ncbi:MAG: hypothetical protein ACXWWM_02555 [Candidatus Deferrimicrobiaceae bacterium]